MSVSTCDPLQLDNLATCFRCYNADALAIKTYLLCQTLSIATPPCVTPSAPTSTGFKSKTDTTIRISWFQPANSGSLITSYTIKWGTVTGVYTNSATVGISPKLYTITGLTQGTQYFWVIQANSFAGCSSANSAESNTTTNGAAPTNGLLNSLISYWKFDLIGDPTADSVGANAITLNTTTAGVVAGVINAGLFLNNGGSHADHADNTDFSPVANTSIAFSMWIFCTAWAVQQTLLLIKGTGGAGSSYIILLSGAGKARMAMWDSTNTAYAVDLTPGLPTNSVWHHIVISFDSPNKLVTAYYDGVLQTSQATTTGSLQVNANTFMLGVGAGNPSLAGLAADELAMWHKALTQTDVTNLYNGGAGLPLSSYQA